MAENTVERMKEQLQCSIYLSIYSEPKQLQCNHIFCQKCLVKLEDLFEITCPTCRQPTAVPVTGVAGLQPAFHIQALLEVIASGEQETTEVIVGSGEEWPVQLLKIYCSQYKYREAELYCETCEQLICYKCVAKGSDHHSHEYKEIEKACEGYMTEMNNGVTMLKKLSQEVSTQQEAIQAKINKNAEKLHADIEHRKTQMLSELHKVVEKKFVVTVAQLEETETTKSLYQNQFDVLSKGVSLINQMKKTAVTFRAENMKPDIGADMILLPPTDGHANLGQVLQCYATGEGLAKMSADQYSTITLYCHLAGGVPYTDKKLLVCKLLPEMTEGRLRYSFAAPGEVTIEEIPSRFFTAIPSRYFLTARNSSQGQFRITCKPAASRWHKLHITVCGQHIRGSPFRVNVIKL